MRAGADCVAHHGRLSAVRRRERGCLHNFRGVCLPHRIPDAAPLPSQPDTEQHSLQSVCLSRKIKVGIVGATGAVGQRFISLLQGHPWFEVALLGASPRSAGKPYGAAAKWQMTQDLPADIASMKVVSCAPDAIADWSSDVDMVFSALDASVAGDIESACLKAGVPVFTNAKNFRTHPAAPLVVPAVNAAHLQPSLAWQRQHSIWGRLLGGSGDPAAQDAPPIIVTNANCSTTGLTIALAPLQQAFGLRSVHVTTMQAISGAGYPGVPAWDMASNLVPNISGEEDKIHTEYRKIMGTAVPAEGVSLDAVLSAAGDARRGNATPLVQPATFGVSAHTNRVPVLEGHTFTVTASLASEASVEEVLAAFEAYAPGPAGVMEDLPSTPREAGTGRPQWIQVRRETNRPQPAKDAAQGRGFTTVVGQVRRCPITPNGIKFTAVSHNTVMGAAGSSILNAEACVRQGILGPRPSTSP